jgi:predicted metal-binding membrane protein
MLGGPAPESASGQVVLWGRDGATVATGAVLVVITAVAWAQVVSSAMTPDPMRGMMMAPTVFDGLVYVVGWTVMMAAMMLPSALPMIALYAGTQLSGGGPTRKIVSVALFTLVYLGVWATTGVPMYFASTLLATSDAVALGYGIAAVLVVAGIFQISPLKQMCLRHCRSPLGFFLGHWRAGWRGSLAMGWAHALYCLGCCWALMVVLVVAGAMGLAWVLLISSTVAAEKLLPGGRWIARGVGVALVLLGLAVAIRPDVAMALRAGGHSM